jgi:hypothetical protein
VLVAVPLAESLLEPGAALLGPLAVRANAPAAAPRRPAEREPHQQDEAEDHEREEQEAEREEPAVPSVSVARTHDLHNPTRVRRAPHADVHAGVVGGDPDADDQHDGHDRGDDSPSASHVCTLLPGVSVHLPCWVGRVNGS